MNPNYQAIPAAEDRQRYIDIYNRHTKYAPYTIPLTMDLMENHVLRDVDGGRQLCLIGKSPRGEGIVHAGLYVEGGAEIGLVHLLFADHNNVAEYLLRLAEDWFRGRGVNLVRACNWRPNPYHCMLHGAETYVWGGAVPTINAYRRLDYDLQHESVVMICPMDREPEIPDPEIPGLIFTEEPVMEDDLRLKRDIRAFVDGRQVGHCSYEYLKAISRYFGKPMGQIAIHTEDGFHGKGLGRALLLGAHRALYGLGARQVMLHTVQDLFRAIKLYEKVGYREQNIRGYCYVKEFERDFFV